MSQERKIRIGLVGNPNCGKSSLFNILTGQKQKISNYPGVTVDKKSGFSTLISGRDVEIIDLPGLYSLYPSGQDERLVVDILLDNQHSAHPDHIIYVADATNLERHLLLASQVKDLGIPMVFALNMIDVLEDNNQSYEVKELEKYLGLPVIPISSRSRQNIKQLLSASEDRIDKLSEERLENSLYELPKNIVDLGVNTYREFVLLSHSQQANYLSESEKGRLVSIVDRNDLDVLGMQYNETMDRYNSFSRITSKTISSYTDQNKSWTDKIDSLITNRFVGPIIFLGIMLIVFQLMYSVASYPMDWIESSFSALSTLVRNTMPEGWYTNLIVDGLIAGLAGVLVFIPQIAILFLLIGLLEESGYMSRAVYMFDGIMQRFGMNGRSVVALVSSGACAIPAIMSARTIAHKKERLITILVSPLISCSARLPVYAILVGFVVSEGTVGIFNKRGLVFMGLFLLGIVAALVAGLVFKLLLKTKEASSMLILELPQYKPPLWSNIFRSTYDKVKSFVVSAGKIIVVISMVLWVLTKYGPSGAMENAVSQAEKEATLQNLSGTEKEDFVAGKKVEASFAGHIGKFMEPAIKPLGYDWKIGIALLTSFAAREVFVGTMATIYAVGSSEEEATIRERMDRQVRPDGSKIYNRATSLSLLVFYVFAMQCLSTLAVTKAETGTWKWPVVQFLYMGALAYFASLLTFQLFS